MVLPHLTNTWATINNIRINQTNLKVITFLQIMETTTLQASRLLTVSNLALVSTRESCNNWLIVSRWMRVMLKVDLHMDLSILKTVQLTVVNGCKTKEMARAPKSGLIPQDTRVAGRTTRQMVTVN